MGAIDETQLGLVGQGARLLLVSPIEAGLGELIFMRRTKASHAMGK